MTQGTVSRAIAVVLDHFLLAELLGVSCMDTRTLRKCRIATTGSMLKAGMGPRHMILGANVFLIKFHSWTGLCVGVFLAQYAAVSPYTHHPVHEFMRRTPAGCCT